MGALTINRRPLDASSKLGHVARGLSYSDAARILGGKNDRYVAALDTALGGALLATAVVPGGAFALGLLDAVGPVAKVSGDLLSGLREHIDGVRRFDRTQRLEAAHAVLVLAAFFEELAAAKLPDLGLPRDEQLHLATSASPKGVGRLAEVLLRTAVPCPSPASPYENSLDEIGEFYRGLAADLEKFVRRDHLTESDLLGVDAALTRLPQRATTRYEVMFRKLATDFPEVAFWAGSIDHQATRRSVAEGLAALGETMERLAIGRAPDQRREAISRAYRAALQRPILSADETPDGVRIPALGEIYINPRYRVRSGGTAEELASERSWQGLAVCDDLQPFLAGYFTGPQSTRTPLLILGQPGSGKSVFSRVIAARLPASDYLTVLVPLREVPAEADVQTQIEFAVRLSTGETVGWPELVRSAGDALPVVILDGFDELVQATGTSQADYLERLTAFQQRETEMGRPLAIVVTSRTAVADRARVVAGMVTARIEPFDADQVRRWLTIWKATNIELTEDAALAHPDLSSQPLLLLMLALYAADGNQLPGLGAITEYELYENLLTAFARREVRKDGSALPEPEFRRAVERELKRLSVVAFAMFNRNRQWTTGAELDRDLPALLESGESGKPVANRIPLTASQMAVGRFYFVHRSQAMNNETMLSTCEFLHATFGEFLVARLIVRELDALIRTVELNEELGRGGQPDDDLLFALLSHTALTNRNTVLNFLSEGLPQSEPLKREILRLFRRALYARRSARFSEYQPADATVTCRHAAWSANLVLLAVLVADGVTSDELFPTRRDPISAWRQTALLWRAQLNSQGWNGMVDNLELERGWKGLRRVIEIRRDPFYSDTAVDLRWSYDLPRETDVREYHDLWNLRRNSAFLCDSAEDTVMHVVEAFNGHSHAVGTIFQPSNGVLTTPARAMADLLLVDEAGLADAYVRCLEVIGFGFVDSGEEQRYSDVIRRMLVADQSRLPEDFYRTTVDRLDRYATEVDLKPEDE